MGILSLLSLLLALHNPFGAELATPRAFIGYTDQSARIAVYLEKHCDAWRSEAERLAGISLPGKVAVLVPYSRDEFEEAQPKGEDVPLWAQAVAYPKDRLIVIKGSGVRSMNEVRQLFLHEYTHLLLGNIFAERAIPDWLHEGLAMLLSGEWDFSRMITMSQAVMSGQLIPLAQLNNGFPVDEHMARIAYAESYYALSFFIDSYGSEALGRFIRDYGRGFGFDQSLYRATGLKPDEFSKKWERFVRFRFSWLPLITSAGTFWFFLAVAFILAYLRKKRSAAIIRREWEEEDAEPDEDDEKDDGDGSYGDRYH